MPQNDQQDDLDAFFMAAEQNDRSALSEAAHSIADAKPSGSGAFPSNPQSTPPLSSTPEFFELHDLFADSADGPQKFIAVEADSPSDNEPFILIPQHIARSLPWWAWVSIFLVLAGVFLAVMILPDVQLSNLTARLGTSNANTQSAMRQLVLRGDEHTVNKLYELASSQDKEIEMRLRAVDTLSLIQEPAAERALLRLELASNTDARVRQQAIAARRQRESSKSSALNR